MIQQWFTIVLGVLSVLVIPCCVGIWKLSSSVLLQNERFNRIQADLLEYRVELRDEVCNGLKRDASISAINSRLSSIEAKLDMLISKIP